MTYYRKMIKQIVLFSRTKINIIWQRNFKYFMRMIQMMNLMMSLMYKTQKMTCKANKIQASVTFRQMKIKKWNNLEVFLNLKV